MVDFAVDLAAVAADLQADVVLVAIDSLAVDLLIVTDSLLVFENSYTDVSLQLIAVLLPCRKE